MATLPHIVGIGASAGGLEALREFVRAVPRDSGLAYVVVQHLAPDRPSMLDKLLGEHASIPVGRIEDGGAIEPDRVYVVPPGPFLEIADGRFRLVGHASEEGARTPIDRFFASLAEAAGRSAFAVVLSGTGSDGTTGVRAIKSQGGVAIVQESVSARFPGMPDSAAATGLVDLVLEPGEMPGRIVEIVQHRLGLERGGGRDALLREIENGLPAILDPLADEDGNSFAGYKPGTLVRRVARRMTLLRQSSVEGYVRTLRERAEERKLLAQDFLIGVTQFFRDPESFDAIRDQVLRRILAGDGSHFRVWVPGCSTGEEAYSLGIMILELVEETGDRRSWKIFGTDIDQVALRHARHGRYPAPALEGMVGRLRDKYFHAADGAWQVDPRLREMCVFAPHNLLQDPPFSKLDLISCRNVLIYLSARSQEALLPRFHYALNPSGHLWLGPSETVGKGERYFRTADGPARIFRRDDAAVPGYSALGQGPPRRRGAAPQVGSALMGTQPTVRAPEPDIASVSEEAFLRRFAPAFATINRQDEVVYVSDGMARFVRPSRGATSVALDDFLASELRLPVHSALDEAREGARDAEVRNVVVEIDGQARLFDVQVSPVADAGELMLLAVTEVRAAEAGEIGEAGEARRRDTREQELILTRKRLATVEREYEAAAEELRGANEELLSMNEELQSSNEELETSREELQSINEELETINAELTENNRQLTRANSDMKNLLESTDIATLFIDENDCVRLYTPEVRRLFGVQERDVGRSIHDLARHVDYPGLAADAAEVRRTLQPIEREVRIDATDETFATWIRPYRTIDDRLDGTVITFVDVTQRKRTERELKENARTLREQYAELAQLYDTAPVGLNLLDRDLRYLRINETLAAINGYPAADHIGRLQEEMLPEAHAEVSAIQRRVLETGEPALGNEVETVTAAAEGAVRTFVVDFYPVRDGDAVFAVGSCVREVTKERELQRRIAESEARLAFALETNGLGAWDVDLATGAVESTPMLHRIFGNEEPVPDWEAESTTDYVLEEDRAEVRAAYEKAIGNGEQLLLRYRIRRTDGAIRWVEINGRPVVDPSGTPSRFAGTIRDVTDEVDFQERERADRNRLQRLQDSLNAFIGLLAPDGTLLEANSAALEVGNLEARDVVGKKLWDTWWWSFSEESRERLEASVARAARGETLRYDVPVRVAGGEMLVIDFQLSPILGADGRVVEIVPSAIDVTERVQAERRKDILLAELEHRVKNTLATVQSIARFSNRWASDKEQLARSLSDRLAAIARTHDALTASGWEGEQLRALLRAEIGPYVDPDGDRFSYAGDDLLLSPANALPVGLAIHELVTNAAKYGALSTAAGRIEVAVEARGGELVRLEWREVDGPPVTPPRSEGFGMFLVGTLLERELRAHVTIDFDARGVRCIIARGD
jgi:two-component system CheB/CheR fusion protein